MNKELFISYLDDIIPNPKCELNYKKDYELLIAVMLSAQCTDKRVNMVTKDLFNKYDLKSLAIADVKDIEKIIHSLGNYHKKSEYVKYIASHVLNDYNGIVPNNRNYLESLLGIGRKTCNVVLSELYDEPTIAVDTHVERVSKRLGLAKEKDTVQMIEKKLMKYFDKEEYNRVNHQLVLFGRYYCKSVNPVCDNCMFKKYCKKK